MHDVAPVLPASPSLSPDPQNPGPGDYGSGSGATSEQRIVTSAAFGGKCLDVPSAYEDAGTPVQIRTWGEAAGMTWSFEGDGPIQGFDGNCVTLAGEAQEGTPVRMDPCTGGAAQHWIRHDNG